MMVGGGTGPVGNNVMPEKVRHMGKSALQVHYLPPGGEASKKGLKRMETESPQGKVVQRALLSVEVIPQNPNSFPYQFYARPWDLFQKQKQNAGFL